MTELVIDIQNLNFKYGNQHALKNIDLKIPKGSIFGFIGHNGAGKTTTIKLILDLLENYSGSIKIFNKSIKSNRKEILSKIGSLVEYPGIYHHLTAFQNLKAKALIYDIPDSRIVDVLSLIKLDHVANKKTSEFSQGMKQRLGIGLALLNDPDLLILDEPTNGLDPLGIIEIRNLITELSKKGKTILLSSHLLSEIEKFITHMAIIDKGEIVYSGSIDQIKNENKRKAVFKCDDYPRAIYLLSERSIPHTLTENGIIIDLEKIKHASEVNKILVFGGVDVESITHDQNTLEELFFKLTKQN